MKTSIPKTSRKSKSITKRFPKSWFCFGPTQKCWAKNREFSFILNSITLFLKKMYFWIKKNNEFLTQDFWPNGKRGLLYARIRNWFATRWCYGHRYFFPWKIFFLFNYVVQKLSLSSSCLRFFCGISLKQTALFTRNNSITPPPLPTYQRKLDCIIKSFTLFPIN